MAKVFKKADGYRIQKLIGMHVDVQAEMDVQAHAIHGRAVAILAAHSNSGDSHIEPVSSGKKLPDRYIVLNDTRGDMAAMTIEYGRGPSYSSEGHLTDAGMPAIAPLRKAANMPTPTGGRMKRASKRSQTWRQRQLARRASRSSRVRFRRR